MKRPIEQVNGTELAVCEDIAARQQKGLMKYGTSVADNPLDLREWLQHAYEETLDTAVYLKRAILELEAANGVACRCGKKGSSEKHTCPYKVDIDDDSKTLCNCCADCQHECSMDI